MYLVLKDIVNTGIIKDTSSKKVCYNNWLMLEGHKYNISRSNPKSWLYIF